MAMTLRTVRFIWKTPLDFSCVAWNPIEQLLLAIYLALLRLDKRNGWPFRSRLGRGTQFDLVLVLCRFACLVAGNGLRLVQVAVGCGDAHQAQAVFVEQVLRVVQQFAEIPAMDDAVAPVAA